LRGYYRCVTFFDPTTARRDAFWTAVSLAVVLAWDASGADLGVMHWFGDVHGFSGRNQWFFARVLHDGGRWLSAAAFIVVLVNAVRPWPFFQVAARGMEWRVRWWWLAVTVVCLVLIPTLKHRSATSCPWDLVEFSGTARYVSHWAMGVVDGGGGRCFPSGHASAAFSFWGGWFALRSLSTNRVATHAPAPTAARVWLAAVAFFGVAFSIAQSVRGAHYPSHSMWTAWICWATSAALWHAVQPWFAHGRAVSRPTAY
jgi:membrane-associated PAP2 superfamily phosphatase